jgi:hypothetical protein
LSDATQPASLAIAASFPQRVLDAENRIFMDQTTRIVALLWLGLFAWRLRMWFLHFHWPYLTKDLPVGCVDFGVMWLSGRLAALHEAARVFDYASFTHAQAELLGAANCKVLWEFSYPPTLLFFTIPFGLVPFATGFLLWSVLLAVFFLGAVYTILRRVNAVIGAPAIDPAVLNLFIGQNAFLTAGLFGFALATLERRPVLAGFFLALLTYKPQFGILIPIALIASRNWRALASATVFTLVLAVTAAITFGSNGWSSFLANMAHRNGSLSADPAFHPALDSIYGIVQAAGMGNGIAWAAQGACVVVLAAAIWNVWSRPIPYAIRAALLSIACLLANPYVLYYDLCSLVIAFAFLVSDGLRRGFLPGERTILFVCWAVFSFDFGLKPAAIVISMILLFLIYLRIVVLGAGERPEIAPAR